MAERRWEFVELIRYVRENTPSGVTTIQFVQNLLRYLKENPK